MTTTKKKSASDKEKESTRDIYDSQDFTPQRVNLTTAIISSFACLVLGLVLGANWGKINSVLNPGSSVADKLDFSSLNEVYEELVDNFDGEIDTTAVYEEAKRGLVNAAGDKYTYYMTATEAEEFQKDLEGDVGAGIGVEIALRDNLVKVVRTTPDNPARKAGVLAGDIIYKINDEDVSAKGVEDVAKLLRGAEGTSVKLTVVRDSKEKEFTLTREKINNVSVYADYDGNTLILTVSRFDSDTGKLAREYAKEAKDRGIDKVILDLRGNGGGYVSAAKELASLWIDGKVVLEQKSRNGQSNETTYAETGKAIFENINTVVLVNGNTASASEIVVGALHDYNKAYVIGEKTYGKGSVQALKYLDDGDMLRVTIAKWYTPNGNNINGDGIEPDKVVERTYEQINKDIDPQLDAAKKHKF